MQLGNSVTLGKELDSWTCRTGKNTYAKLDRASFREGGSLLDKGICNAKQPSPSQKRTDTQRGLGKPKSSHLPPVRPAVPGNLWLAQALNHMTAQAASWVQGGLEYSSPSQPLQAQTLVGSLSKSEVWACVQGPKRGLKE